MKSKNTIISLICIIFIVSFITSYSQTSREVQKSFPLPENGKVFIDTYKGSIKINTWDKAEVDVYVKIEADESWNGTDPEEQLEEVQIRFKSKNESLFIESDYKKSSSWFGSQTRALVHYEISMPKSALLNIDDYKSISTINDVHADIEFETYKGRAKLTNIAGAVDIDTYKGNISLDISELTGNSSFETYKGDIKIKLPSESAFTIDADIGKKGDFDSEFEFTESNRKKRSRRIKATVNGGGHYLEFETYKGEFSLRKK